MASWTSDIHYWFDAEQRTHEIIIHSITGTVVYLQHVCNLLKRHVINE